MGLSLRGLTLTIVTAASLLLSACLITPGAFTSELTIRRDGSFSYAYRGDIHFLALSQLADQATDDSLGEFSPTACQNEETFENRTCTAEELAQQRADWEQGKAAAKKKRQDDAEQMKTLLGGIDPADPRAAEEFATRLRRQSGWRSVVNKGNGRFEVDFAVAGRLDHDFVFPTMEGMPVLTPFVTAVRRNDKSVRINAPAFFPGGNSNPMLGMAQGLAQGMGQSSGDEGQPKAGMPDLNGTFTVVTDGEILANNTDEGPLAGAGGKRLEWKVNARTPVAPSALIKLP